MKAILSLLGTAALLVVAASGTSAVEDKKDSKSPLPGNAEWELKAFSRVFRVLRTDYDAEAKQVKWTVQTREGHRTSDFLRDLGRNPFTFQFLDGNDNELATIQLSKDDFRGIPNERVMREGTRLTITLDVPRAMPKTKKVVLQHGRM